IGGIAQGLQQSGAVANQFGLTLEDNATALAMFANAGIQGSDAGTLLKSALLALTDQGKPAQAAIEELGLSVYDAQG
ncbi:phage tail tape measure protein, partial [Vibrio parahaemolyticus]